MWSVCVGKDKGRCVCVCLCVCVEREVCVRSWSCVKCICVTKSSHDEKWVTFITQPTIHSLCKHLFIGLWFLINSLWNNLFVRLWFVINSVWNNLFIRLWFVINSVWNNLLKHKIVQTIMGWAHRGMNLLMFSIMYYYYYIIIFLIMYYYFMIENWRDTHRHLQWG